MVRLYCVGAFRALGQYWNPQRSGQGHKGQWEWRKRKRRVGASTYWKHGQPTASTTAFFWSWLSLDALLKFHKYSNAKLDKKMYLWLNSKAYLHFSCSFKELLDTQQHSLWYHLKRTQTHFHRALPCNTVSYHHRHHHRPQAGWGSVHLQTPVLCSASSPCPS